MVATYNPPESSPADAADPGPGPAPARERPNRPVSKAKRKANKANAARSTGAKTPQGKLTCSLNAVKHGMTARTIFFLPGEDQAAYDDFVNLWITELGAVTSAECTHIEMAVYSLLRFERARNALGVEGTRTIRNIASTQADRIAGEVRDLMPQLPLDPRRVVDELRKSSLGCSYLLSQWLLIKERLSIRYSLEVSQRATMIELMGLRASELFRCALVFDLDRNYLGAISGPEGFTAAEAANALMWDRPEEMSECEFERRLELMVENLPTEEEGHAVLMGLVDRSIAELSERVDLLKLREAHEREDAADEAQDSLTPEGEKHKRYVTMAQRDHDAVLRGFHALKAARYKYGDGNQDVAQDPGLEDSPEEAEEDAGEAAREAAAPAGESRGQNEPTVTQVAGQTEACDEVGGAPGELSEPRTGAECTPSGPQVEIYPRLSVDDRLRE
jgi:hypothetical protein